VRTIVAGCFGFLVAASPILAQLDHQEADGSQLIAYSDGPDLISDMRIISEVDRWLAESLPITYTQQLIVGALRTPTARTAADGSVAIGGGREGEVVQRAMAAQLLSRLEMSLAYARNQLADECAEQLRTVNLKWQIVGEHDSNYNLPSIALGAFDVTNCCDRSVYVVATQILMDLDLEASIGWASGCDGGIFGSAIWSPLRRLSRPSWIQQFSLIAEWGGYSQAGCFSSGARFGAVVRLLDFLQLSVSRSRDDTFVGLTLHTDLGYTKGWVPKLFQQPAYRGPMNLEPIGPLRSAKSLATDLALALQQQGLVLQGAWLQTGAAGKKELRIRVINQVFRWETEVRSRIQQVLAALLPEDIESVLVIINAYGADTQQYRYNVKDLRRFACNTISSWELEVLSPIEAPSRLRESASPLYMPPLHAWIWDIRPYVVSNRSGSAGWLDRVAGITFGPQGYIFNHYFYQIRANLSVYNGLGSCCDYDTENPSALPNIVSDSMAYLKQGHFQLANAFLQRIWSWPSGWYLRASGGYFDIAFAGVALEALYFPVGSPLAVGLELAPMIKRRYSGFGVSDKVRYFDGCKPCWKRFLPTQALLDLYYWNQSWQLDLRCSVGWFAAHDFGSRFEVGRYWPSGLRIFAWWTFTDGRDSVNGSRYYDKGVGISIPIDVLLPRSSRGRFTYANSGWIRDVGQRIQTGVPLYRTILEERLPLPGYSYTQ